MAKKKRAKKAEDKIDFEESLGRLEEIVHQLEGGELGLNDSLARYEEGVKLLRQSYDALQNAERQIELLSGLDAQGNPVAQPFDDTATLETESNSSGRSRSGSGSRGADKGRPSHGGGSEVDSQEGFF